MDPNRKPRPAPELIWREVDDGVVLVSPSLGKVRALNAVGTTIWRALQAEATISEIVAILVADYQVTEAQAQSDLAEFLADLAQRELLIWD